ncbi:MAG TPA: sigma-70 family RNA polymerase sigma factor [Polyangiales bacterium]|nr:sigma-70 family RNA polymerase sigma factor [Polyangiales bacterium]
MDHLCRPYLAIVAHTWFIFAEGRQPFDDELLVQRWLRGDVRAAQLLVQRYADPLHRFFARRRVPVSEDLVQQTFAACFLGLSVFRRQSSFRTFLFGIARHQLRDHRRAQRRHEELHEQAVAILGSTDPVHAAEHGGDLVEQALERAIAALPEQLRVVIELSYWEQRTQLEIARELGVTRRTVSDRLRLARASLEEHLVRERTSRAEN